MTALFTMRRYKANIETQEIAQNLENKCVQLDYIARIAVLTYLTFRRWECNFSIYFLCDSYLIRISTGNNNVKHDRRTIACR